MKLKMENVSVKLGGKNILKDITFVLEEGSFTSVLGPSGCGKSTLLKTIAGIIPCGCGNVYINGRDVTLEPVHKRGAVIVFQDLRLFPHMTVYDNIEFPMRMQGMTKKVCGDKIKELLKHVHLEGYEGRFPEKLSGGEAQRVALVRALAAKPDILLLDEPFSGLDENLRFDMQLLVEELHKKYNMTTIMVTHDKEEALSISDKVMVMNAGEILQSGTPKNVYENPNSIDVAVYFGNAAFVKGTVRNGVFNSAEFSFRCNETDGNFVLMVRHDAVEIKKGQDFKLRQVIYNGVREELLFEHNVTGLRIKYFKDKELSCEKSSASFDLIAHKIKLFKA